MKSSVVILIFNRPDSTEKVFERIRQAQPRRLFIIADGPRPEKIGEYEKCLAARSTITDNIDWECEVFKDFSDINLGCAKRVSTGLDWVFSQVDDAIILEDDCVPNSSFFRFCDELLDRYREDDRVVAISGQNVQFGRKRTSYSYYFSRYNHCWGWASWKRAWKYFDFDMKLWPETRVQGLLKDILIDPRAVRYWTKIFETTYQGHKDSWAYRWLFACWMQNGLTILSDQNLVSNIGFGTEATNTVSSRGKNQYAAMPTSEVDFPLTHPPFITFNRQADEFTQNTLFNPSIETRAKTKIWKIYQNIFSSHSTGIHES